MLKSTPAEQPPPDALPVEMRTHDDLGQSSRNVLYGEADGDVEAALGSGTSLRHSSTTELLSVSHLIFLESAGGWISLLKAPDACLANSAWESLQEQNSIWNE